MKCLASHDEPAVQLLTSLSQEVISFLTELDLDLDLLATGTVLPVSLDLEKFSGSAGING